MWWRSKWSGFKPGTFEMQFVLHHVHDVLTSSKISTMKCQVVNLSFKAEYTRATSRARIGLEVCHKIKRRVGEVRRLRVQKNGMSLNRTMRILTVASSAGADLKLRTALRLGRRSAAGAVGAVILGAVGAGCGFACGFG
jgi:hypothetical protein